MLRTLVAGVLMGVAVATGVSAAGDSDFFFRDGDRVVFLGDSITQQRLYTTYVEAYTLTRFPHWSLSFRNVGWGGDTAWLRKRIQTNEKALFAADEASQQKMVTTAVGFGLNRDVLPLKPTAVTVDFGMNDHAYQAFRPDIFKAYIRSQREIVSVLATNGARVALLTPQPIEDKRPDPDKDVRNLSLRKFGDGLKELATNGAALYVDQFDPYMALMVKAHAAQSNAVIGGGDAVHPGPAGHTLMAWVILKGLGAPALVSGAKIDVGRFGWRKVVQADQCRISKVRYAGGKLSFQRSDEALPMPIDTRATAALALAPVLDELSRYELTVAGLEAARYEVAIDGEKVGTVSREELEKGWNLAGLPGPIARQGQEVLSLVFAKNDLYFKRWRDCQLSPAPEAQQKLPELDAAIAAKETEINLARQPKPHRFELTPVP